MAAVRSNPRSVGNAVRFLLATGGVTVEAEDLVSDVPPMTVEYSLTGTGRTLLPIIEDLRGWSMSNIDAVTTAQQMFDHEQSFRAGACDPARSAIGDCVAERG